MAAASNYLENKLLDHALGTASFTMPATVYLGLFTSGGGLEAGTLTAEISGGSYTRKVIDFAASSGGSAANSATIDFTTATATWGTITHIAVLDASTGGNVLYHGAVSTSKLIESGDTFQVSTGNMTIALD